MSTLRSSTAAGRAAPGSWAGGSASLVCGILAVVAMLAFWPGALPLGIAAVVTGLRAVRRGRGGAGLAGAGVITGVIALSAIALSAIVFCTAMLYSHVLYPLVWHRWPPD